jgi:glycerol-3-phosphate acyltransferase PlsY
MNTILAILLPIVGYLCGSLASAVIVCRIGGKKAAALTLAGDALKGVVPVLLAYLLSGVPSVMASTAVAAVVGHMYPVFFQFKGGKGVATAFGAVAGLVYPVALFMVAVWVLTAMASRYASLASMAAAVAAPLFALVFIQQFAYVVGLAIIAALLVYRHRDNIQRLRDGTENEINL